MAIINEITTISLESEDQEQLLGLLTSRLGELLNADSCFIEMWDQQKNQVIPGAAFGLHQDDFEEMVFPPGELSMAQAVINSGKTLIAEDYQHSPLVAPFCARSANERSLAAWLARVEAGVCEPPERERLAAATARGEAAFLGLRTRAGLAATPFAAEFGAPPRLFFGAAIDRLLADGLLAESPGGDLALAPGAWLFADTVAEHFVGAAVDSTEGA